MTTPSGFGDISDVVKTKLMKLTPLLELPLLGESPTFPP